MMKSYLLSTIILTMGLGENNHQKMLNECPCINCISLIRCRINAREISKTRGFEATLGRLRCNIINEYILNEETQHQLTYKLQKTIRVIFNF